MLKHSLEWVFADEILSKINSVYIICSSHCEHKWNESNEYPCERFDLKDALWDKDMPDDQNLESQICEEIWDYFQNCEREHLKDQYDLDVFFDINCYRIMPKLPIKDLEERKEELEEEFKNAEDDDERGDIQIEYDEVIEELVDCAKKMMIFDEWLKEFKVSHKEWVKGFIITINDDDEYGFCCDMDEYLDRKDEEQLRRWTPTKIIDERDPALLPCQTKILEFHEPQQTLEVNQ